MIPRLPRCHRFPYTTLFRSSLQSAEDALVKDFNAARPAAIAAQFLPQGELIDDEGNVYRGREELQQLFSQYFARSEEHTSELQSLRHLVCRLLLEKTKQ